MNDDLLPRHHQDLAQRIESLLTRAAGGDPRDLAREWDCFEHELLEHFALEEQVLFPRFSRAEPDEAAALTREHRALRQDLLTLGVRADLHFLRLDAVRSFVADLSAHAAHEERVLYPWAQANVEPGTWAAMAERLRSAGRAVISDLADLGARTL
jgi:iron-sulfur cluster repair protein YtfE (RIC family)